ncbi:hypothetical protein FR742_38355 [Nonomuraea sp. C10]|nr:hypothetical protein FR742_38355 [Nonomuraea sp. C10]
MACASASRPYQPRPHRQGAPTVSAASSRPF